MTVLAPPVARTASTSDRKSVVLRIGMHFGTCMVAANVVGSATVFAFLGFMLPRAQKFTEANVIALIAYLVASMALGSALSAALFSPIRTAVLGETPLDEAQRTYVVRHPLRQTVVNFALWMGSELVFVPLNARFGAANDLTVAVTILLGAITTCGLTYLLAERLLRPINELAFADGLPTDPYVPGVKSRILLAWGIGSAVPLIGVILMAANRDNHMLSRPGLAFLGCDGVISGIIAMLFASKSVADPVGSVTAALGEVEAGRFDVRVPVYDGSEIGRLQSGVNTMVDGLRERQQLRDLFGRQVGEDVARQSLERGTRLGGEQVDAAVLFVDVIGSTALAETRPADEVVAALNAFFAVVVDVVDRTGGSINKFEGDAALCVFGAPVQRDDAADCALLAARLLHERLTDVDGLSAAVGVSGGPVVAGNIGTRERFEYTLIGDAVNEAARLTEIAKTRPDRLLASWSIVKRAGAAERARWREDGDVVLRGRAAATRLAVPA